VTFGTTERLVTGTGSDLTVSFDFPAAVPATHTFTVTTLSGAQSATTSVAAPPVPAPVVGDLAVAKVEKVGRNNRFKVSVACEAAAAAACRGKLKVRTARKVERADGTEVRLVVAKSAYSVEPGRAVTVRLSLTKPARAVLGKKRIRVVATQTARGAEPVATKFWLRRK
jgi:hypothetical protein